MPEYKDYDDDDDDDISMLLDLNAWEDAIYFESRLTPDYKKNEKGEYVDWRGEVITEERLNGKDAPCRDPKIMARILPACINAWGKIISARIKAGAIYKLGHMIKDAMEHSDNAEKHIYAEVFAPKTDEAISGLYLGGTDMSDLTHAVEDLGGDVIDALGTKRPKPASTKTEYSCSNCGTPAKAKKDLTYVGSKGFCPNCLRPRSPAAGLTYSAASA